MKKQLLTILAVVLVGLSLQGGCAFPGLTSSSPTVLSASTSSAIVVNAEKALRESKDTIDTFLHLEYNHRDFIKKNAPAVHNGAEVLRRKAPDALIAADRAKNVFKHNRNSQNEVDLMSAVSTVTGLAGQAKAYTETLNNTTP